MSSRASAVATVTLLLTPSLALAQPSDAGIHDAPLEAAADAADVPEASSASAAPAADDDAEAEQKVWASCIEHVPSGASRPKLEQEAPSQALAGYAIPLEIKVEHGLGETVLPNGFHIQRDSDAARALASAGLLLPDPDGGAAPTRTTTREADKAITHVVIPFLALPPKAGRHELTLPPVPIAVSRASGELLTLCTAPHSLVVEDPVASEADPKPKQNPDARRQRETWTLARDLTYGLLIGAVLAALVTWLVVYLKRRPRPAPPPPPPRPPWELALEQIEAVRQSHWIEEGRLTEYVDAVSDLVRRYLGSLYGFDGIESTTSEVVRVLRTVSPLPMFDDIRVLLEDCDLVKFARVTPTADECTAMLDKAEQIVRTTMPAPATATEATSPKESRA